MSKLSCLKFPFVKYQGAGNDFILIDDRTFFFDPSQVPALCHRQLGIGADGVILLQDDSQADFRMRIFNKDGSEAESCGNGLRCLLLFLLHLKLPIKAYRIATGQKEVEASYLNGKVSILLSKEKISVKRLYIDGQEIHSLDTGVPHAVLFVPQIDQVNVIQEAPRLRYHPHFQPAGTNVNFAEKRRSGLYVRTYERGLEAEPLACGTGAAAVAVVASQLFGMRDPIQIICPGGVLEFYVDEGVRMVGPAAKVFEGLWQLP